MTDIVDRLRGQEPLELGDRLAAATEIDRLRQICAAAYQMAGVVDAPERFLDALSRHDESIDVDKLLPVSEDEIGVCIEAKKEMEAVKGRVTQIGCVDLDDRAWTDNLAIALCTYFNDGPVPDDLDEEDLSDTERSWPVWVERSVDDALGRITRFVLTGSERPPTAEQKAG